MSYMSNGASLRVLNEILYKAKPFDMWRHALALAYRGSIAHGTYVPNSNPNSIDDKDIIGIAAPPKEFMFGLETFEQFEEMRDSWDVLIYDFKKFVRLLIRSNPNVMGLLWTPAEFFLKRTPEFELLQQNRHLFVSKTIYKSFCGYSQQQLHRMEHQAYAGYMGEKRKTLVDKYGFDVKNGQHLVRLLRQGIEFLETGNMEVYREKDRDELIQIKTGQWKIEKVKSVAEELFKKMEEANAASTLPDAVDFEKINKLVQDIMVQVYR